MTKKKEPFVSDFTPLEIDNMTPDFLMGIMDEFFRRYPGYPTKLYTIMSMCQTLEREIRKYFLRAPDTESTDVKWVVAPPITPDR